MLWWYIAVTPIADGASGNGLFLAISRDVSEKKASEEARKLLGQELQHRLKNTIAMVQAIANQSLRNASSLDEAKIVLSNPIAILGRAHDILLQEQGSSADLVSIVGAMVDLHADRRERFVVEGVNVNFGPKAAMGMALALHELATNAQKYGALSSDDGLIEIRWELVYEDQLGISVDRIRRTTRRRADIEGFPIKTDAGYAGRLHRRNARRVLRTLRVTIRIYGQPGENSGRLTVLGWLAYVSCLSIARYRIQSLLQAKSTFHGVPSGKDSHSTTAAGRCDMSQVPRRMSRESLLAAIVDSAIDYAIISMDRDGIVMTWNEGAKRILGWDEEEMAGNPADVFFTPEDRQDGIPQKEMAAALAKGRGNDERWHLRKDGTRFWASGEMMALRDGDHEIHGYIKVLRDRTEKRLEEERRRADAEFMQKVLYSSDDCIKVLDLDANLTFMSEGGMRVMEIDDFNKVAGCPWPDFWKLEGNAAAKAAVAAARNGESARFTGYAETFKGNGKWWDVQVSPMYGADGKPERILSVSRDITTSKTAEETQRLLMHELAHRVKNSLAVVQSIAAQSLRNATSLQDAGEKLQSRIGALAKANDVLMQSDWVSASLRELIETTAANVGVELGERLDIRGAEVSLSPQATLQFSLVVHELLTNALKYGALATSGRVDIAWRVVEIDGIPHLNFEWKESGGAAVAKPERIGFGSRLIKSSLGGLGKVDLDYAPNGVNVRFLGQLSKIETDPDEA